jgi:hypothetical protein
MTRDDQYEPNRFLGLPRAQNPRARQGEEPNRAFGMPTTPDPYARQGEEPQRAFGVPVDWIGPLDRDLTRLLAHPIRGYRRWRLRRRLGPYAPDEDGPGKAD